MDFVTANASNAEVATESAKESESVLQNAIKRKHSSASIFADSNISSDSESDEKKKKINAYCVCPPSTIPPESINHLNNYAIVQPTSEEDVSKASNVEIPINPKSYETFYIMSGNPERQDLKSLMICSSAAGSLTYSLAVRTNILGRRLIGSLRVVKDSEQFLFVAGLMAKNMRTAQNRSFGWKAEDKIVMKENEILTMIPVSSFLNSRCYDAAEPFRFDDDIILVTYVPISEGDQVFTHYCKDYKISSRDVRKKMLNDGWQFDCHCLACKDNWSAVTPTFWTDQDLPPRIVKELHGEMRKFKCLSLEEIRDPMKMILLKEKLCHLVNFIYPRVKKPCINVDVLVFMIDDIHMKLSSTLYPRFVDKFNGSGHDVYNLEILTTLLKSSISSE